MYGGYRSPQTATFDAPSNKNGAYNEDALPAMPSWEQAQSRHVEDNNVEMEQLDHQAAQQESLLPRNDAASAGGGRYYNHQEQNAGGDLGTAQVGPYHNYDQYRQFAGSPVSTAHNSMYPPTYRTRPQSSVYEPSVAPSYHTAAPSIVSPVPQQVPVGGVGRKPVQGSWRDI